MNTKLTSRRKLERHLISVFDSLAEAKKIDPIFWCTNSGVELFETLWAQACELESKGVCFDKYLSFLTHKRIANMCLKITEHLNKTWFQEARI